MSNLSWKCHENPFSCKVAKRYIFTWKIRKPCINGLKVSPQIFPCIIIHPENFMKICTYFARFVRNFADKLTNLQTNKAKNFAFAVRRRGLFCCKNDCVYFSFPCGLSHDGLRNKRVCCVSFPDQQCFLNIPRNQIYPHVTSPGDCTRGVLLVETRTKAMDWRSR